MSSISRLAKIGIEVKKVKERRSTLRLVDYDTGYSIKVKSQFGYNNLRDFRQNFDAELLDFKRKAESAADSGDFVQLSDALRALDKIGTNLFYDLFETKMKEVINFFERFLDRGIGGRKPSGVMRAEISPEFPVPFEFVIVPIAKPHVRKPAAVTGFASRVLGYSFITERVLDTTPLSSKVELWGKPMVPIKYFCNASLNIQQEKDCFHDLRKSFEIEGPWPTSEMGNLASELMFYLHNPHIGFGGEQKPQGSLEDQIHHLSCHCYTDCQESSERHSLGLAGSSRIQISDLKYHLAKLRADESQRPGVSGNDKPLLFLNACGSSKVLPAAVASFPEFFLYHNRNCGFIGVETDVPNKAAIEFSKLFYTYLLGGKTLGEALYLSKWTMLQSDKNPNPLGILYTSYGPSKIHIVTNTLDRG